MHSTLKLYAAPLAGLLLLACNTVSEAPGGDVPLSKEGYTNPVVIPLAADPSVVRGEDGRYYLFATADDWGDGQGARLVPRFVSDDLVRWAPAGTVFSRKPTWKADGGLWAPDVSAHDGTYYLYYAFSTWGDPNPCIGLATAANPAGAWTDLGRAVFCSADIGVPNSIDPFAWYENGQRTLIWGSFHGIFAVPLSNDGTRAAGEKVRLTDDRFEAPYVYRHGGYYYLFLSAGSCCDGAASTYTVYVGRSKALDGPYVDAGGRDLRAGGGTLVVEGSPRWAGPGHNAVVTDDAGQAWIVYHAMPRDTARLPNGTNRRQGLLDPLVWSADGWPSVAGHRPGSDRQAVPTISGGGAR